MTSQQIIGGTVAVAIVLAFIAGTIATQGWLFFGAIALAALVTIFFIGAEAAK